MFGFFKRDHFPTILHISHAKAGSTWVDGILRALFGARVRPRGYGKTDFSKADGAIFSLFITREELLGSPAVAEAKRFVVLRDLRDTLVSRYFSIRESHELDPAGKIAAQRAKLQAMNEEEGLAYLMGDGGMESTARIQRSWLGSGETMLRYEDLIANDVPMFTELFVRTLGLPVNAAAVEQAVVANRFEKVFQRKLGDEDVKSHGRKGTPGDWRNHFTPALTEKFHGAFGDLLKLGGWEEG